MPSRVSLNLNNLFICGLDDAILNVQIISGDADCFCFGVQMKVDCVFLRKNMFLSMTSYIGGLDLTGFFV